MKKLFIALIALPLLAACNDTPKEASMRASRTASFHKQATYGDCDVGYMTWFTGNGGLDDQTGAKVVICKGQPSTSISYTSGKSTVATLIVGSTVEELEKQANELKKQAELKKKQDEALSKLTEEERKLLNLN